MPRLGIIVALVALVAFLVVGLSAAQAAVTNATLTDEQRGQGDPALDGVY